MGIDYPLMFNVGDAIAGAGYLALVNLAGRALMVHEDDGRWWTYGVTPGALADSGQTPEESYFRFRQRYKEVLFDFAVEANDFDDFSVLVQSFFDAQDEQDSTRWDAALEKLRSGENTPEEPFSELPRKKPAEAPDTLVVSKLEQTLEFKPSDNIADAYQLADAA